MASRQSCSTSHVRPAPLAAIALLAGALVTAQGPAPIAQGPPPGKRVEVLFLGHTRATEVTDPKAGGWYHDSDRFAPMLKAALAPYGFNFSYTTDSADLNAANLAKYDALLIYANHRTIARRPGEGAARFRGRRQGAAGRSTRRRSASRIRQPTSRCSARSSSGTATGEFTAAFVNPRTRCWPGCSRSRSGTRPTFTRSTIASGSHRPDGAAEGAGREPWTWVRTHGQGPRLLHRLWPRRAGVEPSELPRAHEERDDLGDRAATSRPNSRRSRSRRCSTRTPRPGPELRAAQSRAEAADSRSRPAKPRSTCRSRPASSCSCSRPSR